MTSMKRLMHVAAVALMASGMVWAQSSTTPCTSTPDTKSETSVTTAPSQQQPGSMSAPVTANQATSQKDATSEKNMEMSRKNKNDAPKHVDWDAAGSAFAAGRP